MTDFDVVIVGAGFAGMYMLHRVRALGMTARAFESGGGVGGTWYWNRYPGARVDIRSLEYSFSFSPELEDEWQWSEHYSPQPELLRYANHVADRFDLRRDIRFDTRVSAAVFDATARQWAVTTDKGDDVTARFVVMATGCLSVPTDVDFEGIEDFAGAVYRTSRWPHEGVDFSGLTVGVIGTGSSAIQSIPVIARQADQLTVFQRTPNYSVPARNRNLDPAEVADWTARRAEYRQEMKTTFGGFFNNPRELLVADVPLAEAEAEFESRWQHGGFHILGAFADTGVDPAANKVAADFHAAKIREIVKDPVVADKLIPKDHPWSTKRLCVDSGYYDTFNRDNVDLVDLKAEPILGFTPTGLRTAGGDYPFDAVILATGFDAMTGALARIDIRGRNGEALRDRWADGPRTYLGLMVAGFPNLFTITGPGSPSVLTNMMTAIEQHVDWVANCIAYLASHQQASIEPTAEAEAGWVAHVNDIGTATLYPQANSWYMGANVPGKPRQFLPYAGGFNTYREQTADIAAMGYEGFIIAAMAD